MSKELEALNELFDLVTCQDCFEKGQKCYDIIEEALQRLEQIDNAKPSEALKWLEHTGEQWVEKGLNADCVQYKETQSYREIKQYILKAQEQEKEIDRLENKCLDVLSDNIRLEKVLKIIKEKNVDIIYLKDSSTVDEYNSHFGAVICKLTKEEFELLKRYCNG